MSLPPLIFLQSPLMFSSACGKTHRICHGKLQGTIQSVSLTRRTQGVWLRCHFVNQPCYFTVPGRCLKFVHFKKIVVLVMTGSTNLEIYYLRLFLMPRTQKLINRFSWDI